MQTARLALGLSQKDLAAKTNEKANVSVQSVAYVPILTTVQLIGEYESGKAIPSPQILSKFERILNVKLT